MIHHKVSCLQYNTVHSVEILEYFIYCVNFMTFLMHCFSLDRCLLCTMSSFHHLCIFSLTNTTHCPDHHLWLAAESVVRWLKGLFTVA